MGPHSGWLGFHGSHWFGVRQQFDHGAVFSPPENSWYQLQLLETHLLVKWIKQCKLGQFRQLFECQSLPHYYLKMLKSLFQTLQIEREPLLLWIEFTPIISSKSIFSLFVFAVHKVCGKWQDLNHGAIFRMTWLSWITLIWGKTNNLIMGLSLALQKTADINSSCWKHTS